MSYEEGKWLYAAALGTATLAAGMIGKPWAKYVVLMIGVVISDPGRMSSSADAWRGTDGGSPSELTQLDGELTTLKNMLGEYWSGPAFEEFTKAHEKFSESLKKLEETRNSTGEAIDQNARLYYWGAITCTAVAGAMLAIGLIMMFLRRNVYGNLIAHAFKIEEKIARTSIKAAKNVLLKLGIGVGVVAGLMYVAIQQAETTGKAFPLVKGIPTAIDSLKTGAPEFTDATIQYDKQTGQIIPKVDVSSLPGGLG
ncbi:WXG100 family type VII secretion target [Nonomuraea sp. MG754425]|uniref:WXG100 family type VII secretion target n=1 Tax=Nonomuraea sp. MG754425 TaxID=2570319 RepID=UPI001F3AF4AD|nr:WXG100 family type VII secretion target [Nonomuraea sp. MG754425]MCF6467754.1 WXG100 family type VII secretion target [Nonomuraea sp. MG754425]